MYEMLLLDTDKVVSVALFIVPAREKYIMLCRCNHGSFFPIAGSFVLKDM